MLRVEADDVDPVAVIYSQASGSSGEFSLAEIKWLTSTEGIAALLRVRSVLESRGTLAVDATLDRASESLLRAQQLLNERCPDTERANDH